MLCAHGGRKPSASCASRGLRCYHRNSSWLLVVDWGFLYRVVVEQMYRSEISSYMDVIRSQRHDYNFHVQTIAGLVNSGNLQDCQKYVSQLVQDSLSLNAALPVQDPAIAAMINNFQMRASGEGIRLHINIQNDMSQVVTNVYETNKVISNLLQNAIDEVRTHSDKSYGIRLYIFKRSEYCVIRVENAFKIEDDPIEYVKNIYSQGYTTKKGHEGVGLSSISTTVSSIPA